MKRAAAAAAESQIRLILSSDMTQMTREHERRFIVANCSRVSPNCPIREQSPRPSKLHQRPRRLSHAPDRAQLSPPDSFIAGFGFLRRYCPSRRASARRRVYVRPRPLRGPVSFLYETFYAGRAARARVRPLSGPKKGSAGCVSRTRPTRSVHA